MKAGDPVARLIDDDAKIALEKAESALAEAQAEPRGPSVEQDYAQKSFDAALAVTENAAATEGARGGQGRREPARAPRPSRAASPTCEIAEEELAIQKQLAQARTRPGHRAVELAEAKVRSARGRRSTS